MLSCNILFSYSTKDIANKMKNYLRKNGNELALKEFVDAFINKDGLPKDIRFKFNSLDNNNAILKSIKDFIQAFDDATLALTSRKPEFISDLNNLKSKVLETLQVDLDEHSSGSTPESDADIEAKTIYEILDTNLANLEAHFADLYGTGAYNIIRQLEEQFGDDISASTFFNIITGKPVLLSNTILNKNIINLKSKYFKTLIDFLKAKDASKYGYLSDNIYDENGKFIGASYYEGLKAYYDYIKKIPNLKNLLDALSSSYLNNVHKENALNLYKDVITKLLENPNFSNTLNNKYKSNLQSIKVKDSLYEADHLQAHYYDVKRWAEKYGLLDTKIGETTIKEAFKLIEANEATLLNATKAYTCLTHFDELLVKSLGDMIGIKLGQKGFEFGDTSKYSFKLETSHLKKGWQQSESIESEKYAANLTKLTLNQIRVFNHKTGLFQNRRTDVTSVIVAARNLIDDIVYGRINPVNLYKSNALKTAVGELIRIVTDLHSDPIQNFPKMLQLLFGKIEGGYEGKRLVDNIHPNSKTYTTNYDLSTLYSLYLVLYNLNNPNSVESNELKSVDSANGPIQMLTNEVASLIDRNVTIYYTETTYDKDGFPSISVKKRYFNNLDAYKHRLRINNRVNKASTSEVNKKQRKYNFEVFLDASKLITYIIHFGDTKISCQSPNILKGNVKYNLDNGLFNSLDKIDLTSFRHKIINKNEDLNPLEKNLYNILEFIDTLLDLHILNDQGLLLLETFNLLDKDNIENLLTLAMRAAYINLLKYDAASLNMSLKAYLQEKNPEGLYSFYLDSSNEKLFKNPFNLLQIMAVAYNDATINSWSDAYSILTGQASKSTTKNNEGDNIPNNSVNKLGTNVHHYLKLQQGTSVNSLYFVQNMGAIKSTLHDLETISLWRVKKQVKNFSQPELMYHAIFNKFWGNYAEHGTLLILPTCYSDKTTFINYEIDSKLFDNKNIIDDSDYVKTIVNLTIRTIGVMYKEVFRKSVERLNAITAIYNADKKTNLTYKLVLKLINTPELMSLAKRAGVNMRLDLDYRKVGNHLCPNELLEYYANELYADKNTLARFLNDLKILFLLSLLDNDCLYLVLTNGETVEDYLGILPKERKSKTAVLATILKLFENDSDARKEFFKNWVDKSTGRLILAKQGTKNIINYEKIKGDVELNPLLDKFFYIEGFLSNNMRMSLTGNELNHPNKAFNTLFDLILKAKTPEDVKDLNISKYLLEVLLNFFNENKIDNVSELNGIEAPENIAKFVDTIYHKSLNTIANVAQGTLFKRNVIIPATLQYCTLNLFNGIPPKVKCAVIMDEKAPVYNYKGTKEKDIDSADGSAQINPFQSILENMSLGSLAVGFIKKPIWHSYDAKTGSAFLAKFATDTITNETMRSSLNSHTNLFNLFRKMTNLKWDDNVDLMQSIVFGLVDDIIAALRYWNNCLLANTDDTKENLLYYKDKYGDIILIVGFNKTTTADGMSLYYTNEAPMINGIAGKAHKVYHVFEGNHHLTFDTYLQASTYIKSNLDGAHTIKSLFELHTALGSINCVDSKGNSSEFNNLVVVNFMNNVGYKKPDATSSKLSLANYVQPLKLYHIGYALNNTAVKNGALNINESTAWYDDSELNYFEVNSDGLGMQMNADHDIINSELTEFSLVITATSAYGYTFNLTNEIFQGLGRASLASTKQLQQATDAFINSIDNPELALSDLYDAVGRVIMTSKSIKDKESLQGIIMEAVSRVFYKSKDHNKDSDKIPFSDPNIYSDFIATLTSTINKEAIKRKHPGSGCVMVPAYHTMQYFEVGGLKLMFNDVLNKALLDYKNKLITLLQSHKNYNKDTNAVGDFFINGSSIKSLEELVDKLKIKNPFKFYILDTTTYNLARVRQYLREQLASMPVMSDRSWFMPSDNVRIIDKDGKAHSYLLDSMDAYYKFKDGLNDIEIDNNVSIKADYKKSTYTITDANNKCVLSKDDNGNWVASNSALSSVAALIVGEVKLPDNTVVYGAYKSKHKYQEDITTPHDLRPSLIRWQDFETGKYVNIFDSPIIKNAYTNPLSITENHQALVQLELNLIYLGKYTDSNGTRLLIREGSLENDAAELIMSNIYKEKFGIENESLAEVLEQGESYFFKRYNKLNIPSNPTYDIAFAKDTGLTTLIKLSPVQNNAYIQLKEWNPNLLFTDKDDKIKVVRGNKTLFTIGRWVNVDNVTYKDGDFIDNNGYVLDKSKYRLKDISNLNSVQERVDYVKLYDFTTKFVTKEGNILYRSNPMYEIADIDIIKRGTDNNIEDAYKLRASIIANMYLADEYKLALVNVNKTYSKKALKDISSAVSRILTNFYVDNDMKDLLRKLLSEIEPTDFVKLDKKDKDEITKFRNELLAKIKGAKLAYSELFKNFLKTQAHKRYVSFLDSLNFIAARIPALSLLSFMTMKNIAWTENSKNVAYVSHFLTFLQGSDYRLQTFN